MGNDHQSSWSSSIIGHPLGLRLPLAFQPLKLSGVVAGRLRSAHRRESAEKATLRSGRPAQDAVSIGRPGRECEDDHCVD